MELIILISVLILLPIMLLWGVFRLLNARWARVLKICLLAVLVVVVAQISIWGYRNINGYCHESGRYLTDKEVFREAMRSFFSVNGASHERHAWITKKDMKERFEVDIARFIPYSTVDQFFEFNKDCCQYMIESEAGISINDQWYSYAERFRLDFLDKLLGDAWRIVILYHKIYYMDNNGYRKHVIFVPSIAVNTCGKYTEYPMSLFGN